jgi:hypothetical protein
MKRSIKIALIACVGLALAAVFLLPVVPVKVEPFCAPCPGGLFILQQGYASPALYLAGYGGIYLTSLPNYAPTYVGYCVVYGSPTDNSCGLGIGELWRDG